MILSDRDILDSISSGWIGLEPFDCENLQPCSVDLTLGRGFIVEDEALDVESHILEPDEFILATTRERVSLKDDVLGRLEGKSSLARLGLLIHATAGFIDPGFKGTITLEIKNISSKKIRLDEGMKIAQICFEELSSPCARPYGSSGLGSHYQGQEGTTPSYMVES